MTERRAVADILDECLERVLRRGETVEACLADYPEHAAELRELLTTALVVQRATAFTPSADAKRAARLRLHDRLDRLQRRQGFGAGRLFPVLAVGHRLAVTGVVLVLAVVLGGTGTVLASTNSLPGDALYPLKRVAERTQLALAVTEDQEADAHARLLDRRTRELAAVTERGRGRFVARLAQQIEGHAERAGTLTAAPVQRVVATLPAAGAAPDLAPGAPSAPRPDQAPSALPAQVPADRLIELNQKFDALQATLNDLQSSVVDIRSKAAVQQLQRALRRNREHLKGVLLQADALHLAPDASSEPQAAPEPPLTPAPASAATPAPTPTPVPAATPTPLPIGTPTPAAPAGRPQPTPPAAGIILSTQTLQFAEHDTAKGILIRPVSATEWKARTRVPGLTLVPTSGTFSAGQVVEVAALLDRASAAPGQYPTGITVTTSGPAGSKSVSIHVTVLAPTPATPTPTPASAGVAITPRALQFAVQETSKTFTIIGGVPVGVEWTAAARPFLALSANKGKLALREQEVVTVKVDRSVMAPGIHATAIVVTTPLGAVNVEVVVLVQLPPSSGARLGTPKPATTPTLRDISREVAVKGYRQVEGRVFGVTLIRENGHGHVDMRVALQDGTHVVVSMGGPGGAKLVKGDHAARLADIGIGDRVRLIVDPERERVSYIQLLGD